MRAPNRNPWFFSCPTALSKTKMDGKETACRYLLTVSYESVRGERGQVFNVSVS